MTSRLFACMQCRTNIAPGFSDWIGLAALISLVIASFRIAQWCRLLQQGVRKWSYHTTYFAYRPKDRGQRFKCRAGGQPHFKLNSQSIVDVSLPARVMCIGSARIAACLTTHSVTGRSVICVGGSVCPIAPLPSQETLSPDRLDTVYAHCIDACYRKRRIKFVSRRDKTAKISSLWEVLIRRHLAMVPAATTLYLEDFVRSQS
ncbi:unnamed protein product [Sympodiomycopsis kandeliae]